MMNPIRVVVNGALGDMGREVTRAVIHDPELRLVGGTEEEKRVTQKYLPLPETSEQVPLSSDLDSLLKSCRADVLVDFTNAAASMAAARITLRNKVNMVIGTTGLPKENLEEIDRLCRDNEVAAIEAANFSLGSLLMIHLAKIAAKFFDYAEIVETHLDKKPDAPSATSIAIAKAMLQARGRPFVYPESKLTVISNTRGGQMEGIAIHSRRSPGVICSEHEVIFSRVGQNLSLRDETVSRETYVPGVILAIKEIVKRKGLTHDWVPWEF